MSVSRRSFIQRSSLLAASVLLPMGCSDGTDAARAGQRTAIVIGSGFAGSVAALRLGLAGIPTIVLERGQQWTVAGTDTFPTTTNFDRRATWSIPSSASSQAGQPGYAGLLETIAGANVAAVCGACVGGGSLVYGGVLIQPAQTEFERVFPFLSYAEMDSIYYRRVLDTIGAAPIPDDVLATPNYAAHRTFIRDNSAIGYEVQRPHTGFDWNIIRQEINGEIPPAASIGEYAFGCNSNAKLSTDKNYLRDAVATGNVEIRSLTEVEVIRERNPQGYSVMCRQLSAEGEVLDQYELAADYLFMAAGSMNTTRLLLKSQATGELKGANDRVGHGWGTNGDLLLAQNHPEVGTGFQGGPACIASVDRSDAQHPVTFMHSPVSIAPIQLQMSMSVPDVPGQLAYDLQSDATLINWEKDTNTPSALARQASFERLITSNGGAQTPFIQDQIWHPLGGAVMNDACDELGQLYGYRNLFVVDGSLLPGSAAGVNPALTVAANAERVMEGILGGVLRR
ncbi:MAG: GMC family oxidoreductase N-terminal domain-containing protein [Gammaproteobacteria bacterium]|nr:GMC family oxidoreductase N-terminal domain-containing protein [Gammaproteobacteria bacterium]